MYKYFIRLKQEIIKHVHHSTSIWLFLCFKFNENKTMSLGFYSILFIILLTVKQNEKDRKRFPTCKKGDFSIQYVLWFIIGFFHTYRHHRMCRYIRGREIWNERNSSIAFKLIFLCLKVLHCLEEEKVMEKLDHSLEDLRLSFPTVLPDVDDTGCDVLLLCALLHFDKNWVCSAYIKAHKRRIFDIECMQSFFGYAVLLLFVFIIRLIISNRDNNHFI